MAPDPPPPPVAQLFCISANDRFDLLAEMYGVAGDGAAVLLEEPATAAVSQPGDLLLRIMFEARIRMAYVAKVDIGGEVRSEDGSSSSSSTEDEEYGGSSTEDEEYGGSSSSTEDEENGGSKSSTEDKDGGSSSSTDSAEGENSIDFSSNSVLESEDKEKNHHLHIRIWPDYCVLVLFEGECWKLTKQHPIQWLQKNQMEQINQKIITENGRIELDGTKHLEFIDLSKQMCSLGFIGVLECSKNVSDFIYRELSPDLIKYNIDDVLGHGATCKVYGVITRNAIKKMELTEEFDDEDALMNREPREVVILSSFRRVAIVSFFQAWAAKGIYKSGLDGSSSSREEDSNNEDAELNDKLDGGREQIYVAIQMEFCGRTLSDFLDPKNHQIDVEEAWLIFEEITKAVQCIHRSGVIHRDLKPKNIFFGYADTKAIKIGDFGHACWAKQYANGEAGSSNRGTTMYCAPELNEKTSVTQKADIYSLGIILVELFHRFRGGHHRVDVLKKLKEGEYPSSSDWYGDVELLKQMVGSSPSQRLSADQILEYISNRI